ncbi:class I SAM-dependent methyltransferase [Paraburkholderia sp.]|jgi:2-polyprenyl-3-methyl-5-hydroxy-6-metoxy-1,4-benzoquinol methylase|uniref:class I SAM-dependent methyltransferase n=1 Tax=Paraburkholderia sp. TaxID=1926495 RepID=UPI002F424D4C
MQQAQEFWDGLFRTRSEPGASLVDMPDRECPVYRRAVQHFGPLYGKTLIDLGSGAGASSLYFASLGADVISVDLSPIAVENLKRYCAEQRIDNIRPVALNAHDIGTLPQVDFVFGSMILHHIEPFEQFSAALRAAIKPGGRAFFWENNGASDTMMWFRDHVIGKLWIPKYGDVDESPLAPREVNELRKHFDVTAEFPEMVYVQMASTYLLRGRLQSQAARIDQYLARYPSLRKYSYRQYLCLS